MSSNALVDITPEDSTVPIFRMPEETLPTDNKPTPDEQMALQLAAQEAAVLEIMNNGYSENTARIMAGLPALPA